MVQALRKFLKVLSAIIKIIPVIIEILADFADDGKRNNSNTKPPIDDAPTGASSRAK
jgi:hypothetical protein